MEATPVSRASLQIQMRRNEIAKLPEYTELGCGWFGISFFSPPSSDRVKEPFQPLFFCSNRRTLWDGCVIVQVPSNLDAGAIGIAFAAPSACKARLRTGVSVPRSGNRREVPKF